MCGANTTCVDVGNAGTSVWTDTNGAPVCGKDGTCLCKPDYTTASNCALKTGESCGDNEHNVGEECDDGNSNEGDGCRSNCEFGTAALCGANTCVDVGSAGISVWTDTNGDPVCGKDGTCLCKPNYTTASNCALKENGVCGDNEHNVGEDCDDGNFQKQFTFDFNP